MDAAEQTETAGQIETGAARVKRVLLEPLAELGLARPSGMSAALFEKALAGFANNLGYMSEESLVSLRLSIEGNLLGRNQNRWMSPATVYTWARTIEPEPQAEPDLVLSYLRSRAGEEALSGGYAAELRRYLKKYRRPPLPNFKARLAVEAQESRSRAIRIEENSAVGRASEDELAWLQAYRRAQEVSRRIVEEGKAKRAEG